MFQTMPLNVVGGENTSRSKGYSAQSTINLYPEFTEQGRTPIQLLGWPGEKPFLSASGVNRGIICHAGVLYQVLDNSLYSISNSGAAAYIGIIADSGRCRFATDGTNLIIRSSGSTYVYDGTLTAVTDPQLQQGDTVAILNKQAIYQGTLDGFCVSDAGDLSAIDASNIATAYNIGSAIKQIIVHQERVFFGGEAGIDVWQNTGSSTPPFERILGAGSPVGIASPDSMDQTEQAVYFLGNDNCVYRINGYQPEPISTSEISKAIRDSGASSNAVCFTINLEGQNFFVIQLDSITLAYSEQLNQWIRLSSGVEGSGHLVHSYAFCYGRHFIADRYTGNIYEWDFDTNTSNSNPIIRQRITAPFSSQAIGAPGRRLIMSKAEILMETGVGTASGQGEDPVVMISASYDGGKSFTNEDTIKLGRTGESIRTITWYNSASFYEFCLKIRVSDPNFIAIHGGNITVKAGGV